MRGAVLSRLLHKLSYLKYPFLFGGVFLMYYALLAKPDNHRDAMGLGLVLVGFGLGLDGLQDQKVIGNFERSLFNHPAVVQSVVWISLCISFAGIGVVIYKFVFAGKDLFDPIYVGLLSICVGLLGQVRVLTDKLERVQAGELSMEG